MQSLKARVHNGRLVLDEPTDLPEGEVVYSQPVDADDMSDEERDALHDSIREGREPIEALACIGRLRRHVNLHARR
jgi:hypothetical protein